MIIVSQQAVDRQTTVSNLLVSLGTLDRSCFWTSVSLPRDSRYSGFLKLTKLPEKARNAASFEHFNVKNLSVLGSFAPDLLTRNFVPSPCQNPRTALAKYLRIPSPHGL